MEKFKTIKVGNSFVSTTSISKKELDEYLGFSRIKNAMFERILQIHICIKKISVNTQKWNLSCHFPHTTKRYC